jgi:hypothetical protein
MVLDSLTAIQTVSWKACLMAHSMVTYLAHSMGPLMVPWRARRMVMRVVLSKALVKVLYSEHLMVTSRVDGKVLCSGHWKEAQMVLDSLTALQTVSWKARSMALSTVFTWHSRWGIRWPLGRRLAWSDGRSIRLFVTDRWHP